MIRLLLVASLLWLPFDKTLSSDIGFMTVTPYYVVMVVLFVVTMAQIVLDRERFSVSRTDMALVVVCAMYFGSTLLSESPQVAGLLAFSAIFIPTLTYFVTKALVSDERMLRRALYAYGIGVLIIATVGAVEFFAFPERPEPFGRDGVAMASLAVMPLMVGLYGLEERRSLLRFILIAGGVLAIGVSLARAYWILVLLSPVLFWLFLRGRALVVLSAMLAVTLGLTLLVTLDKSLVTSVRINNRDDHGIQRVLDPDHWKAAIYNRVVGMYEPSMEAFVANPVMGRGLYVGRFQQTTTHNLHLEWLESGGILGYLAFLAVYFTHFRQIARRGKGDRMACALGLATFGVLVNGVTNGIMHSIMPTCAMMYLGMTAARLQMVTQSRHTETGPIKLVWTPTVTDYTRQSNRL